MVVGKLSVPRITRTKLALVSAAMLTCLTLASSPQSSWKLVGDQLGWLRAGTLSVRIALRATGPKPGHPERREYL